MLQKTDISTNISTNFDHKKDTKNSQFTMKSSTVYSYIFFLYKKTVIFKHKKPYRKIPSSEQNNYKIK